MWSKFIKNLTKNNNLIKRMDRNNNLLNLMNVKQYLSLTLFGKFYHKQNNYNLLMNTTLLVEHSKQQYVQKRLFTVEKLDKDISKISTNSLFIASKLNVKQQLAKSYFYEALRRCREYGQLKLSTSKVSCFINIISEDNYKNWIEELALNLELGGITVYFNKSLNKSQTEKKILYTYADDPSIKFIIEIGTRQNYIEYEQRITNNFNKEENTRMLSAMAKDHSKIIRLSMENFSQEVFSPFMNDAKIFNFKDKPFESILDLLGSRT